MATATEELDEYGNPKKKASVLQQQDPVAAQPQPVTLSDAALSGAATPEGGNLDLYGTALRSVKGQSGEPTELQKAAGSLALKYVNDPTGGYDPVAAKRSALEKSNQDWANTYESTRQQFGNVSGSGLLQENMLENALQHNVDQQTLGADMDKRNYDIYVDSMGRSLAAANANTNTDTNAYSSYLSNLGKVSSMGEAAIADQLAAKGFDYTVLKNAVDNGTATQADMDAFLTKVGIQVSPNAGNIATDKALTDKQYVFGKTHPEYTNPDGSLNAAGITAFNAQVNQAEGGETAPTYQNLISGTANVAQLRGGADATSENHAAYQAVAAKAQTFIPAPQVIGQNPKNNAMMVAFASPPPAVNSVIKGPDGKIYQVTSGVQWKYGKGVQIQYFTVIDIDTGAPTEVAVRTQ